MTLQRLFSIIALSLGAGGSTLADVFTDVPEAATEGYQVLYDLNLPAAAGYRDGVTPAYTVNHAADAPEFDRVAYYLTLTGTGGTTRWVYASMDAFTSVASQLGLPHNVQNPVKFQQSVKNLNVASNAPGIVTGTFLDGGQIEMWPSNYDPGNGLPTYGASSGNYDWGDSNANTGFGYGSFQVHNTLVPQTLFGYNHWGVPNDGDDDIGIGSSTGANPDWTFAKNAGIYTSRRLVILIRPQAGKPTVTFAKLPGNRAVVPRSLSTNLATVPVEGVESAGGFDSATLVVSREGVQISKTYQPLVYADGKAPFSFSTQITAERANYTFEISVTKGGVSQVVKRVTEVAAGDVYLFYGQSNTEAGRTFAAGNTTANGYKSPWVRTYGQNADDGTITRNSLWWDYANGDGAGSFYLDAGAVGQWALVVGRKISDTQQIPVAILNGARGGYSMVQLQKDHSAPDSLDDNGTITHTYNRLRYRAMQAGVAAAARGIFYYQGESDADDAQAHIAGYAGLRADWAVDYPAIEHFYEVQVRPGCLVTAGNVALRQAQRNFGDVYPDTTLVASNALGNHDGCHYLFTGGYETLGLNVFHQVARDFYGAPATSNLDPLNPKLVEFTDSTRTYVRVPMRDAGATIQFDPQALIDFAMVGTPAKITGATVEGNVITFALDRPADSSAKLEYHSHLGAGGWVTNGNGVGLLSFSEPIATYGMNLSLTSPAASTEGAVGQAFTITAAETAGLAVRMDFLVNGVLHFTTSGAVLNTTWPVPVAGAHHLTVVAYDAEGHAVATSRTIVAPASAPPATGLKLWFKAEKGIVPDANGRISTWQDQSGNSMHATQTVAASRPVLEEGAFGLGPGVRFDGNDFLTRSNGMPTGDYTKVVHYRASNPNLSNNLISSATGGTSSARDHALYAPNLVPSITHSDGPLGAAQAVPVDADTVVIATYAVTGNQAKIYVNGVLSASGALGGRNTIASFQLGAYVSGNFLSGAISEVLVYDHVLSDAERQTTTNYINDRYKTPLQLWLKAEAGATATSGGDANGDGISNLVEYALGLHANVNNRGSVRLPQAVPNGDGVIVSYQRATDRPDVTVELQGSGDLASWVMVSDVSAGVADGVDSRTYQESLPNGSASRYFRLRVVAPDF